MANGAQVQVDGEINFKKEDLERAFGDIVGLFGRFGPELKRSIDKAQVDKEMLKKVDESRKNINRLFTQLGEDFFDAGADGTDFRKKFVGDVETIDEAIAKMKKLSGTALIEMGKEAKGAGERYHDLADKVERVGRKQMEHGSLDRRRKKAEKMSFDAVVGEVLKPSTTEKAANQYMKLLSGVFKHFEALDVPVTKAIVQIRAYNQLIKDEAGPQAMNAATSGLIRTLSRLGFTSKNIREEMPKLARAVGALATGVAGSPSRAAKEDQQNMRKLELQYELLTNAIEDYNRVVQRQEQDLGRTAESIKKTEKHLKELEKGTGKTSDEVQGLLNTSKAYGDELRKLQRHQDNVRKVTSIMGAEIHKLEQKIEMSNRATKKNSKALLANAKAAEAAYREHLKTNGTIDPAQMDKFRKAVGEASTKIALANKNTATWTDSLARVWRSFKRIGVAMIAYHIWKEFQQLAKKAIEVTLEFASNLDVLSARLAGTSQSIASAANTMENVLSVSIQVPFAFDEIAKAATILNARGIEPSIKTMKTLAATAAALDKPLEGITDAFSKIQSGSSTTERFLKPLGIGFFEFQLELQRTAAVGEAVENILSRNNKVLQHTQYTIPNLTKNLQALSGQWALFISMPVIRWVKDLVFELNNWFKVQRLIQGMTVKQVAVEDRLAGLAKVRAAEILHQSKAYIELHNRMEEAFTLPGGLPNITAWFNLLTGNIFNLSHNLNQLHDSLENQIEAMERYVQGRQRLLADLEEISNDFKAQKGWGRETIEMQTKADNSRRDFAKEELAHQTRLTELRFEYDRRGMAGTREAMLGELELFKVRLKSLEVLRLQSVASQDAGLRLAQVREQIAKIVAQQAGPQGAQLPGGTSVALSNLLAEERRLRDEVEKGDVFDEPGMQGVQDAINAITSAIGSLTNRLTNFREAAYDANAALKQFLSLQREESAGALIQAQIGKDERKIHEAKIKSFETEKEASVFRKASTHFEIYANQAKLAELKKQEKTLTNLKEIKTLEAEIDRQLIQVRKEETNVLKQNLAIQNERLSREERLASLAERQLSAQLAMSTLKRDLAKMPGQTPKGGIMGFIGGLLGQDEVKENARVLRDRINKRFNDLRDLRRDEQKAGIYGPTRTDFMLGNEEEVREQAEKNIKAAKISMGLDKAAAGLGFMSQVVGDVNKKAGNAMKHVADVGNAVALGFKVGGPIGGAVAGALKIGGKLFGAWRKNKAMTEKYRRELKKLHDQMELSKITMRANLGILAAEEAWRKRIAMNWEMQDTTARKGNDDRLHGLRATQEVLDKTDAEIREMVYNLGVGSLGMRDVVKDWDTLDPEDATKIMVEWNKFISAALPDVLSLRKSAENGTVAVNKMIDDFQSMFGLMTSLGNLNPEEQLKVWKDYTDKHLPEILTLGIEKRLALARKEYELEAALKKEFHQKEISAIKELYDIRISMLKTTLAPVLDLQLMKLRQDFQAEYAGARGQAGLQADVFRRFGRDMEKQVAYNEEIVKQRAGVLQRQRDSEVENLQKKQANELVKIADTLLSTYEVQDDILNELRQLNGKDPITDNFAGATVFDRQGSTGQSGPWGQIWYPNTPQGRADYAAAFERWQGSQR